MPEPDKPNARERILVAAAAVARESGPGHLSLDAIAHRAGVSKGGLLYHFPTKARLIEALVEDHLAAFDRELSTRCEAGGGLLAAYVDLAARTCDAAREANAWIFTAIAEDPGFLEPIRRAKRRLFERLREEAADPATAAIVFLALEGLASMMLFGFDALSEEDRRQAVATLAELASQ